LGIALVLVTGCASRGGVRKVNEEVLRTQAQVETQAAAVESSLVDQREAIRRMRADVLAQMRTIDDAVSVLNARLGDVQDRLFRLYQKMETIQLYGTSREPASPTAVDSARASSSERGVSVDPHVLYDTAHADFLNGNYDMAIAELSEYLSQFPTGDHADGARYWLAQSFHARKEYQKAIDAFEKLVKEQPQSEHIPGALLGIGRALAKLRKPKTAASKFRDLVKRFPDAPEVEAAQQELKALSTR